MLLNVIKAWPSLQIPNYAQMKTYESNNYNAHYRSSCFAFFLYYNTNRFGQPRANLGCLWSVAISKVGRRAIIRDVRPANSC